jgi:hypothetical protein
LARVHPAHLQAHLARAFRQHVSAGEDGIDDRTRDLHLATADDFKQGLQFMREIAQGVQLQEARAALERMKGAEDGVDGLSRRRGFF